MKPAPLILIFGISGSGKSHLAKKIVRARPQVLRLTASSLLKSWFRTTGEKLRTAHRNTVVSNQSALVDAVAVARKNQWDRPVVLEAHAVIDNDNCLVDVPFEAFRNLGVSYILSIRTPIELISARRKKDRRHRPERTAFDLEAQQTRSLTASRSLAEELGVPFNVINSNDLTAALVAVDEVCRNEIE